MTEPGHPEGWWSPAVMRAQLTADDGKFRPRGRAAEDPRLRRRVARDAQDDDLDGRHPSLPSPATATPTCRSCSRLARGHRLLPRRDPLRRRRVDSDEIGLGLGSVPGGLTSGGVQRIVADLDRAADVVGLTIAEFIPRQVTHLQQNPRGFPLLQDG
ncbi:hypothetical protein [Streptomyces sp. NPDC047042]|uniref:hypothetical protein n=1 Tax=Streptomyces sp. NPDC047042 TaxID=3154807 RepID=UPI00341077A9